MEAAIFFVAGLPAAAVTHQLISRWSSPVPVTDAGEEDTEPAAKVLPWQSAPWSSRVQLLFAAVVPLLAAAAGWRFEPLQAVVVTALLVGLIVCTATDLLRYRVPNAITYPGTVLALAAALVMPDANVVSALAAALLGGLVFFVMAIITRGGLGLGDVKLATLIGAALGLRAAYQALALGIVVGGLVIALLFVLGLVGRKQAVPYAPFLALAAALVVLVEGASFAPL